MTAPEPPIVRSFPTERVHRMDATELLRSLPDACIHAALTDPAYESLERHRKRGTTTRLKVSKGSSNEWFDIFKNERYPQFFDQLYRVLVPRSYALIFCDDTTDQIIRPIARDAGFWVWGKWVWVKVAKDQKKATPGRPVVKGGMGFHGRKGHEHIVVLEKRSRKQLPHARWDVMTDPLGEGRKIGDAGLTDVFFCPRVDNGYPTEKPAELVKELLMQIANPGEIVIDPFAGSGVVGREAKKLGIPYLLGDTSSKAIERMSDLV